GRRRRPRAPPRRRPFAGLERADRGAVQADLAADPLSRGILVALEVTAGLAVALGLAGLLLSLAGDMRDERPHFADLEAQGVGPATLRAELRLRTLVVAAIGVLGRPARRAPRGSRARRGAPQARARPSVPAARPLDGVGVDRHRPCRLRRRRDGPRVDRHGVRVPVTPSPGSGGSAMSAVAVRDLFRVYRTAEGDAPALQGVTVDVGEGAMVALIGPSGSGKSTLVRVLAGLERPSAGSAEVLGADLGRMSERRAAGFRASRLGLVDQDAGRGLPPDLAIADGVGLQLSLLGAPRDAARLRSRELLERVRLEDAAGARPDDLSGGVRQRAAACASLLPRRGLVLADEPTAELDVASAAEVHRLLRELSRESGATVVLVSHDPASAEAADRTLRIADGRLAEERAGGATRLVVGRGGQRQRAGDPRRP